MGDRSVKDFEGWVFSKKGITDSLDKMGFAESWAAV